MRSTRPVTVFWISAAAGGRREPFGGDRYSTTAFFPSHEDASSREWWSVEVRFGTEHPRSENPWNGSASFLAEGAPQDWLAPGTVFELLEGRRLTAIAWVR